MKVQKLEERIEKRLLKIENLNEQLKKEKTLLKADKSHLAELKYGELIKAMMDNEIDPSLIMKKVDEVISESENDQQNGGEIREEQSY